MSYIIYKTDWGAGQLTDINEGFGEMIIADWWWKGVDVDSLDFRLHHTIQHHPQTGREVIAEVETYKEFMEWFTERYFLVLL